MGKVSKNVRMKAKIAAAKATAATDKVKAKLRQDTEDKLFLLKTTNVNKKTITKRDKLRQKHKNLMNKFALLKKKRKEEAARKNREKTAVIGDLKPLKDALPSLDELFKLTKQSKDIKTGVKAFDESQAPSNSPTLSSKQKIKKKKETFIRKVKSYEALLKDSDFKKNPRDAIRYHIQYTHGLINE